MTQPETVKIEPKSILQMSVEELKEKRRLLLQRMRRAVNNYEWVYYNELKDEINSIDEEIKRRRNGINYYDKYKTK